MDSAARRSKLLQMRVTEAELDLIKEAAHLDKSSPVVWARELVVEQAKRRTARRGA